MNETVSSVSKLFTHLLAFFRFYFIIGQLKNFKQAYFQ